MYQQTLTALCMALGTRVLTGDTEVGMARFRRLHRKIQVAMVTGLGAAFVSIPHPIWQHEILIHIHG